MSTNKKELNNKNIVNIEKDNNDIFCATKNSLNDLKNHFNEFNTLLNSFSIGETKVELRKRYLQRMIDETWVNIVEDTLPSLDVCIRKPGANLEEFEEVKPIELTTKVTNKSIVHLVQHTDLINEIKKDGSVMPSKLLNTFNDDTMFTYENKFINTLVYRLYSFVMLRYDKAIETREDEMNTRYSYSQSFSNGETKSKIDISIEVAQPPRGEDEVKNYLFTTDLWKRVEKIVEWVKVLMSSQFVRAMERTYIHPPIMRTNKLLKNVEYNQCLALWEFLETYENTGYETKIQEQVEDVDNDFLENFYNTVVAQYVLFTKSINNEIEVNKALDTRETATINAKVIDQVGKINEADYNIVNDNENRNIPYENESEEDIDFALLVALRADELMFTEDDEAIVDPSLKIVYQYIYSYQARLIKAQNPTQDYYNLIKNELLSYVDTKSNISWKHELFTIKKDKYALLECKGKSLYISLDIDASKYANSDIKLVDNNVDRPSFDFMSTLKITNQKTCNQAISLLTELMKEKNIEKNPDYVVQDFHMAPMSIEAMLKAGLVKKVQGKQDDVLSAKDEIEPKDNSFVRKYSYAFLGRMILAKDPTQSYYTEIKNELLSHEKVTAKVSWKHELFTSGLNKIAKLKVKGKTLCVSLHLDPKNYQGEDYNFFDLSESKTEKDYPLMIKIKNPKALKVALRLINDILDNLKLKAIENYQIIDYHMEDMTVEEMIAHKPPYAKRVDIKAPKVKKAKVKLQRVLGKNNVNTFKNTFKEVSNETPVEKVITKVVEVEKPAVLARYNFSYQARIIRGQYPIQDYYTLIKNKLNSYEELKQRLSWKHELYWLGRTTLIKLVVRGKTLCAYMPLQLLDSIDSKYKPIDLRDKKPDDPTPFMMKVTSTRRANYIIELIDDFAKLLDLHEKEKVKFVDYHKAYKTIDQMLAMEPPLIKLKKQETVNSKVIGAKKVKVDYQASFINDIAKTSKESQYYYNSLKNYILSYSDIKCGSAWSHEEYRYEDNLILEFKVLKNSLAVIFNAKADELDISNVKVDEEDNNKSYLIISSNRAFTSTLKEIDNIASKFGLTQGAINNDNFKDSKNYKEVKSSKKLNLNFFKKKDK